MEESSVAQRWSIRLLALGFSSLLGGGGEEGRRLIFFVCFHTYNERHNNPL